MTDMKELSAEQVLQGIEALAKRALSNWGIQAVEFSLIKYRENAVYKVVDGEGEKFALRVHRLNYHSDAELLSELQWMAALQESGFKVPEVLRSLSGDLFVHEPFEGTDDLFQVDLFAWIEGSVLGASNSAVEQSDDQIRSTYHTIGALAAQLHNHGSSWEIPNTFHRHAWDLDGLVGPTPFWGRFWELRSLSDQQRALVTTARDIIEKKLQEIEENPVHASHYGLIHADFVPENLMCAGGDVRLLDFDDCGFGWHLFELATALYFISDQPHYEVAKAALVEGYRSHRHLPDAVLENLPVFMMARALTYLGWVHTREGQDEAEELSPYLVEMACMTIKGYLAQNGVGAFS